MKVFIITALILFSLAVYPANLVNKDSSKYDLEIKTSGTLHTSINGNTTSSGGAPDGSEILVKQTGSKIKVNGNGDVLIKDGKLSQK